MALEDAAEMPALDPECGRGLRGAHAGRPRELVEQRHLADDVTRAERRELDLLAVAFLDDVDLARADDERAYSGVALTHDVLARLIGLLDCRVRDRVERLLVEIFEPRDALEEF